VSALAGLSGFGWRCTFVGSLDREPPYAERVRRAAVSSGLEDRFAFLGALGTEALNRAYDAADLLVVPSRFESFGMVVLEALARGIAVLACDVGGVREALGRCDDGRLPGMLVPAHDAGALRQALGRWLAGADLRAELRAAATMRRASLDGWGVSVGVIASELTRVAARVG